MLVEATSNYTGMSKKIKFKVVVPKNMFVLNRSSIIQVYGIYSNKNKNILSVINEMFDLGSKM